MSSQRKIRVAVVFGGRSTEHAVSCLGAGHILAAIDRDRYEVLPVGIARDGRWVLTADDPARLAIAGGELPSVDAVATPGTEIAAGLDQGARGLVITGAGEVPRSLGEVDVVLPLLHGAYGEDGTLQGLLEMTGTSYAGAGVLASAAGMDKEYMKLIFAAHGLPVGRYVVVHDRDWRGRDWRDRRRRLGKPGSRGEAGQPLPHPVTERKRVLDEIAELGWPVFVKPARGGSSIGIGQGQRPGRAGGGHRDRARARPQGAGRGGGGRHGDRVRRARGDGRRAPGGERPGAGARRRRRGLLRLRCQIPGGGHRSGHPAADSRLITWS